MTALDRVPGVSLMRAGSCACRAPVSEKPFRVCGAPTAPGASWCPAHAASFLEKPRAAVVPPAGGRIAAARDDRHLILPRAPRPAPQRLFGIVDDVTTAADALARAAEVARRAKAETRGPAPGPRRDVPPPPPAAPVIRDLLDLGAVAARSWPPGAEQALARDPAPLPESVPRRVSLALLFAAVRRRYAVTKEDFLSARRTKHVSHARHVAFWLAKRLTSHSLPAIGRACGGKDHTTVLHGIVRVEMLRTRDPDLAADLAAIAAGLGRSLDNEEG
jgi:hypothetical protein